MIYQFLRWYAYTGIKFFYKKIFINKSKIDVDKPLLFASNHPNGFYESLILTTLVKKPVYFLVRADYVNIKGLKWLFDIIKLYPVYRQSEGLKDVNKNKEVFASLHEKLKDNSYVAIYPEGTTKFHYHIPAIKKGVARLATGAVAAGVEDLKVYPVGFNFNAPHKFRSFLTVNFGDFIDVKPEDGQDIESPAYIRRLTAQVKEGMQSVAFHFTNTGREDFFSMLLEIIINENMDKRKGTYIYESTLPAITKNLSNKIDVMPDASYDKLETMTKEYFEMLDKADIDDAAVTGNMPLLLSGIKYYFGLLFFIPFLIINIIPVLPAIYLYKKVVKQLEYKAVITVLSSQILYLLYLFVLFIAFALTMGYFAFIVLILPFTAVLVLKFYDFRKKYLNFRRFKKLSNRRELKKRREGIIKILNNI